MSVSDAVVRLIILLEFIAQLISWIQLFLEFILF